MTPFPLDGGRAGDGGAAPRSHDKPQHALGAVKRARRLRRESTVAERLLWAELRKLNLNFRRQAPIGRFVVDFVQHAAKLIVEIDGPIHDLSEKQLSDITRTKWLESQGYRVLRFPEATVRNDLYSVADRIAVEASPPSPTLPPSRGKGE
jgi:very-short-patch-repair endonuclease